MASYTASDAIERIKLKAWTSTSSSLSDDQILQLLDDSMRSYIVPFTKALREEWWVGKESTSLTTDSNGQVTIPDSVASTLRTVAWNNAGILQPLSRIEPETSFAFQPSGGGIPGGFMLRGYTLQILPSIPSLPLVVTYMRRPASMVLEESAGEIESIAGTNITLVSMPVAWQEEAPLSLAAVSQSSPFSEILASTQVLSITGNVVELDDSSAAALLSAGDWLTDVDTNPFPNVPIELHPLLELDVMRVLFVGLGDKRLDGVIKSQMQMEQMLRTTMAPRMQGNARPILNATAPGMRYGRGWGW